MLSLSESFTFRSMVDRMTSVEGIIGELRGEGGRLMCALMDVRRVAMVSS